LPPRSTPKSPRRGGFAPNTIVSKGLYGTTVVPYWSEGERFARTRNVYWSEGGKARPNGLRRRTQCGTFRGFPILRLSLGVTPLTICLKRCVYKGFGAFPGSARIQLTEAAAGAGPARLGAGGGAATDAAGARGPPPAPAPAPTPNPTPAPAPLTPIQRSWVISYGIGVRSRSPSVCVVCVRGEK